MDKHIINSVSNQKATMDFRIEDITHAELRGELEYHRDIDHEDTPTNRELLEDIIDWIDEDLEGCSRSLIVAARELAIKLGMYRIITDEEMSNMVVSRDKKYDWILNGKKYIWKKH